MSRKPTIMVVGPMPPAVGGIAIFIFDLLNSDLVKKYNFFKYPTNKPESKNKVSSYNKWIIFSRIPQLYLLKTTILYFINMLYFPILLIKEKPNIVHIHTASYWSFIENSFYICISTIFNKKVILHIHGGSFDTFFEESSFIIKLYIKSILQSADCLVALSNNWKVYFSNAIGVSSSKIYVVYNGYNPSLFYPIERDKCRRFLDLPEKKRIILTVGALLDVKGHEYLINSMSKIIHQEADVLCIIIGDGILKNKLNTQIELLGLVNHVKLIGNIPHNEIPFWMNASNIFVLPSLKEGNPLVMLEALGTGLPFIGTKVGAIPEIICSEEYGLLVNLENERDLELKIINALNKDWNENLIAQYSLKFSWKNVSQQMMVCYDSLLKG